MGPDGPGGLEGLKDDPLDPFVTFGLDDRDDSEGRGEWEAFDFRVDWAPRRVGGDPDGRTFKVMSSVLFER